MEPIRRLVWIYRKHKRELHHDEVNNDWEQLNRKSFFGKDAF